MKCPCLMLLVVLVLLVTACQSTPPWGLIDALTPDPVMPAPSEKPLDATARP